MKKVLLCLLTAGLFSPAVAQEKFELGKPNNANYRYLDEYKALKEYIDKTKYPNFKLGAGTTVNDYLNNNTFKNLINKNFSETVAGNAMKMSSCVDGNGNMNFETVKKYVKSATEAGLSVYGHTLAWHSQQPKAWLLSLIGLIRLWPARTSPKTRALAGHRIRHNSDIPLPLTPQMV